MKHSKKIKVALVAPPFGETGGPEVVTKNLALSLMERDDVDVTLFAPADWEIKMNRISTLDKSLWNVADFNEQTRRERRNLIIYSQIKVLNYISQFDIIHLNSQTHVYLLGRMANMPVVLSMHNRINEREFNQIKSAGIKIVSLSESQAGKLKTDAVIWNGVPTKKITPNFNKGKYLISIGRLADQKGIDLSIKIAKKAKKKLLIFGRVGNSQERKDFFNKKIKPFLNSKGIIYKKEVSNEKIYDYLKNAEALLFPIRRPEVCPMAIMEALASGTPVIGTNIDPLPELLHSKKVAFLSDDLTQLIKATEKTEQFDRNECRKYAEKYFDSHIMAEKYANLYRKIIKNKN